MKQALFVFAMLAFLTAAGFREESAAQVKNKAGEEQVSQEDTTEMTPAEIFAEALVQEVMGETDEPDLEDFLASALYPKLSALTKVTLDRVSSSQFILKYFENGAEKNFLIQKYYNPKDDEIFFEISETQFSNTKLFLK